MRQSRLRLLLSRFRLLWSCWFFGGSFFRISSFGCSALSLRSCTSLFYTTSLCRLGLLFNPFRMRQSRLRLLLSGLRLLWSCWFSGGSFFRICSFVCSALSLRSCASPFHTARLCLLWMLLSRLGLLFYPSMKLLSVLSLFSSLFTLSLWCRRWGLLNERLCSPTFRFRENYQTRNIGARQWHPHRWTAW